MEIFRPKGVRLSEATFRKYVQAGLLPRSRRVGRKVIEEFIAALPLDEAGRAGLARLTPRSYVGLAAKLVGRFAPPAAPPKAGGAG